jgi:hypothetical protein
VAHLEKEPDMTSPIKQRHSGLLLTLIVSAVAVMALGCAGSSKSGTTKSVSTTSAAATTSAAPPGQDNLTGVWSGHHTGAYSGTLTITWQQSGWKQRSPGVFRSNVDGSIKLSAPPGTLSIHGTVLTNCPQAPCNVGDSIKFGTVGGGGITYTGTVSQPHMSGSYRTANGRGSWSASQVGHP